MRQLKTDQPLVEFTGTLTKFLVEVDTLWRGYSRRWPPQEDLWWDSQEAVDECDLLLNRLNQLAPEGYEFKPHVDQPTCWGFWKTDGYYGDDEDDNEYDTALDPSREQQPGGNGLAC